MNYPDHAAYETYKEQKEAAHLAYLQALRPFTPDLGRPLTIDEGVKFDIDAIPARRTFKAAIAAADQTLENAFRPTRRSRRFLG